MDRWIEVAIDTRPEGLEHLGSLLTALDISGFVVEDETDFLTFLEENRSVWDYVDEELMAQKKGISRIKIYLTEDETGREQLKTVRQALERQKKTVPETVRGTWSITLSGIKNEDWEHNWKAYYHPFPVGETLYIVPEWEKEEPVPAGRTPLYLNPGLIFGTGSHASTRLCLEQLETAVVPGERVLDLGCGSGILSIAALLLGASTAAGCDIDHKAEHVALENAARNGIGTDRYQVKIGNILTDEELVKTLIPEKYPVILANIVADVIIALAERVKHWLTPEGSFICSGIIQPRAEEVQAALEHNGFAVCAKGERDGWVCYRAALRKD